MAKVKTVREAALNMERIDTHAHLDDSYPDLQEQVSQYGHFPTTQSLIDSRVSAEGCRVLYDIDPGAFVRPGAPPEIFRKAAELRANGAWEAISYAMDKAGICRQVAFSGFNPGESRPFSDCPQNHRLAYLAYIDGAVSGDGQYPCPDFDDSDYRYYESLCNLFGQLHTLDDYLETLDEAIDGWRSFGVVGMKTAIAYTSGLYISDPELVEARAAFSLKNDMTEEDFRMVHDYALRHTFEACGRNGLPVVIHTGFQIWGHANLEQSNPMLLHNILVDPRYRDITFVLLHGGNPYVGETSYLAGMFRNVIIDFTWIGWMTPPRFRQALGEWLAVVPHDRMCWGSDSFTPESITGIDSIMRRLIADVLEMSIADGTIDESYALEFVENAYLKTPKRVFGL